MLGGHCEATHVRVDVDGLHQAVDGALNVHLFVAVGGVNVAGSGIVPTSSPGMQRGRLAEALAGLCPVLGHLEHVASPLVALNGVLHLVGAPEIVEIG